MKFNTWSVSKCGELWPRCSVSRIVHAPHQIWCSVLNRMSPPHEWQDLSGQSMTINGLAGKFPQNTWQIISTQGDLWTVDKTQGHWRITEVAVKCAK